VDFPTPSSDLGRDHQVKTNESSDSSIAPGLRNAGALFVKRAFDIVVALILLVLTLPFAILAALAIILETRGPIFFGHVRIGKGGARFRLMKFRSMVTDSEAVLARHLEAHPDHRAEWLERHKLRDDPRVTRIGRILRRLSMDELPQLFNVLSGDMSMVGPRPITAEEAPRYGRVFLLYTRVKPGLTGLWQVSDRREGSYRERIELDLEYIRTRTLAMDLVVLVKTIRVVLFGHGAY
jgi:lipopolysaccharide/colanic/teichoic acid biosynthesis glycosyltransferase